MKDDSMPPEQRGRGLGARGLSRNRQNDGRAAACRKRWTVDLSTSTSKSSGDRAARSRRCLPNSGNPCSATGKSGPSRMYSNSFPRLSWRPEAGRSCASKIAAGCARSARSCGSPRMRTSWHGGCEPTGVNTRVRPALTSEGVIEEIAHVLQERTPIYRALADLVVRDRWQESRGGRASHSSGCGELEIALTEPTRSFALSEPHRVVTGSFGGHVLPDAGRLWGASSMCASTGFRGKKA